MFFCAEIIEENIRLWDEYLDLEETSRKEAEREESGSIQSTSHRANVARPFETHQIYLGSPQGNVTLQEVEQVHQKDVAFGHFRTRLGRYLTALVNLPSTEDSSSTTSGMSQQVLPVGSYRVNLKANDTVSLAEYLLN